MRKLRIAYIVVRIMLMLLVGVYLGSVVSCIYFWSNYLTALSANSAPWYTGTLANGIFVLVVGVNLSLILCTIEKKMKEMENEGLVTGSNGPNAKK